MNSLYLRYSLIGAASGAIAAAPQRPLKGAFVRAITQLALFSLLSPNKEPLSIKEEFLAANKRLGRHTFKKNSTTFVVNTLFTTGVSLALTNTSLKTALKFAALCNAADACLGTLTLSYFLIEDPKFREIYFNLIK